MVVMLNKSFLLLSFFLLFGKLDAKTQIIQKSAQKIKSYKNLSYRDIVCTKFNFQDDFSADTLSSKLLIKSKEPFAEGCYLIKGRSNSYAFDGNKLVNLKLTDSTYTVEKESVEGQNTRSLLFWANDMEKLSKMPARKINQLRDTLINNTYYTNILITVSDTIIDSKRQYLATNFIIDKNSNLPIHIIRKMQGNAGDGSNFQFLETHSYSDYRFDIKDFPDLTLAIIPANFRVPPKSIPVVFLPNGTPAPSIKAFDLHGEAFDLEKLKGKPVLINFSLIGCPHCVGAAQMLNRLNEKYKESGLVIVNIYPLDQKDAIIRFDSRENVKTLSLTSDRAVQRAYPFDGYPSFYLLDKNGSVAQSYKGFYKDLEFALNEKIDSIVK